MDVRKLGIVLAAGVFLGGCANQRLQKEAADSRAAALAFCAAQFQPLRQGPLGSKLAFEGDDATAVQMAIADLPSPQEKPIVAAFADAIGTCMDREIAWVALYQPWLQPYASAAKTEKLMALSYLVAGNVSYGMANQRLAVIDSELNKQFALANNEQIARNQLEDAQSLAAFSAAMGHFQQAAQSFEGPLPQPMTFTPLQTPNMGNCRTVFVGNVANTQCY